MPALHYISFNIIYKEILRLYVGPRQDPHLEKDIAGAEAPVAAAAAVIPGRTAAAGAVVEIDAGIEAVVEAGAEVAVEGAAVEGAAVVAADGVVGVVVKRRKRRSGSDLLV